MKEAVFGVMGWVPSLGDQVEVLVDTSIDGECLPINEPHRVVSIYPSNVASVATNSGAGLIEFANLRPWVDEKQEDSGAYAVQEQLGFLF